METNGDAVSSLKWNRGLKKLERFRISAGYTIPSLFNLLNGNNRCSAELKPDLDASNGKPNKALASIMRKNDAPMEPAHVPGMPVQEFADKIRQYASSDITVSEANALACELHRHVRQDEDFVNRSKPSQENKWDASGVGHKPSAHTRNGVDADAHVSAADMEYFVAQRKLQVLGELKRAQRPPVPIAAPSVEVVGSAGVAARLVAPSIADQAETQEVRALVTSHPFFPHWLTGRDDFMKYYDVLKGINGMPADSVIAAVLKTEPTDRRESDLAIVSKWIKLHKILPHVRTARLLEVCRKMKLLEGIAGYNVINEGDIGDAFYIILEGTCLISIRGTVVSELSAGCSFGEKALENNALRSATVTCSSECKFIVVFASDYKNIALCAQMISNEKRAQFLSKHCVAFHPDLYSYPKIKSMSKRFVETTFPKKGTTIIRQNEAASAIYVVLDGEVEITRMLSPDEYTRAVAMVNSSDCGSKAPARSAEGLGAAAIPEKDASIDSDSDVEQLPCAVHSSASAAFAESSISPLTVPGSESGGQCAFPGAAKRTMRSFSPAKEKPARHRRDTSCVKLHPLRNSDDSSVQSDDSASTRASGGSRRSHPNCSGITTSSWKKACHYALYITTLKPGDVFGEECVIEYLKHQHLRGDSSVSTEDYKSEMDTMAEHKRLNREYYHGVLAVQAKLAKEKREQHTRVCPVGVTKEDDIVPVVRGSASSGDDDDGLCQHHEERHLGFAAFERRNSHPNELKQQVSLHDAALLSTEETNLEPETDIANQTVSGRKSGKLANEAAMHPPSLLEPELDGDDSFYAERERLRCAMVDGQVGEPLDAAVSVDPDKVQFSDYSAVSLTDKLRVVVMNKQEAQVYFQTKAHTDALKSATADWRHSTLELLAVQINNRRREHLFHRLKSEALGKNYNRRKTDFERKQGFLQHQYNNEEQMKRSKTKGMLANMGRNSCSSPVGGDEGSSTPHNGGRRTSTFARQTDTSLRNRKVSVDTQFSDDEMRNIIGHRRKRSQLEEVGSGDVAQHPDQPRSQRRRSTVTGRALPPLGSQLTPTPAGTGRRRSSFKQNATNVAHLAVAVRNAAVNLKTLGVPNLNPSAN